MVGIAPFMQPYTTDIDFSLNMQFQRDGTVPKIVHGTSTSATINADKSPMIYQTAKCDQQSTRIHT